MKKIIAGVLATVFVIGVGVIVYRGRPVMKLNNTEATNSGTQILDNKTQSATEAVEPKQDLRVKQGFVETEKEVDNDNDEDGAAVNTIVPAEKPPIVKPSEKSATNMFSMVDVQAHKTPGDCWSAINGLVYNLTSWIDRHPGGAKSIESLCGTDGSVRFTKKHGGASAPQAALVLLKIGALK